MSRAWKPGDEIVRRAKWGTRRRAVITCANCRDPFIRLGNTRYCSDLCRLVDKFSIDERGCWVWAATLDRHGYGTFYLGRNLAAHRAAYTLLTGPIPEGLQIDHLCRNRACVNPEHLEPVTQWENVLRGANPKVVSYLRNECGKRHPMTPANTYVVPSTGARRCRQCISARTKARRKAA